MYLNAIFSKYLIFFILATKLIVIKILGVEWPYHIYMRGLNNETE